MSQPKPRTTSRPQLVHATPQMPHRRGGGTARQFYLLRELAEDFDVTVIAPEDPGIPADARDQLGAFATVVSFPVPSPRRNPLRRAARLARMVGSPRPLASVAMDPLKPPIRAALAGLPRPPDVFYVEPSTTADWIGMAPPGAVRVLGFHDLTFAAYRERAEQIRRPVSRALLEVEWRKLRHLEVRYAILADLNVMISTLEERELRRLAPRASAIHIPNGVDTDYFTRPSSARHDLSGPLVIVGSLNHPPNIDGAVRMARDVLPIMRLTRPEMRLQIVGRAPVPQVLALDGLPGVEVVGEVPDVRPFLAAASIVCVPVLFGGGIRVKLLDALAMGCAVVSTPKGAEGLAVASERQLTIAPLDDFADAIAGLLSNPERTAALAAAGQRFVAEAHAWPVAGRLLSAALKDALAHFGWRAAG